MPLLLLDDIAMKRGYTPYILKKEKNIFKHACNDTAKAFFVCPNEIGIALLEVGKQILSFRIVDPSKIHCEAKFGR